MIAISFVLALLQGTFPGNVPGTEIGGGLPSGYEPSGAVWHPQRNQLLIVSDDGFVSAMNADGSNLQLWTLPGDLEAITYAGLETNVVYIGREHPDAVLEFDLSTPAGALLRTFDLSTTMTGPTNTGLEALTFVPIDGHPEGGVFHAGLQDDGKIYVFDLPIVTSTTSTAVTFLNTITPSPGLTDISGMDFDRATGTLYAIFDSANRVLAMDAMGGLLNNYSLLPGNDQEGIALKGCEVFIAEDVGPEVWVYGEFPDASGCHTLFVDTGALSVSAGGAQSFALAAGAGYSGKLHLLLGTLHGTSPGQPVGGLVIPLNPDPWFSFTLQQPNTPPLTNGFGALGPAGNATATLNLPAGFVPASLVGKTAWHAFVVVDPLTGTLPSVSNPTPLTFLP